jgi:deoxyribonuclease V
MAAGEKRRAPKPGRWFLRAWPGSIEPAVKIQERVRGVVRTDGPFRAARARRVAGIDASFSSDGLRSFCAAIVVDLATFETVETATAEEVTRFPYVPGFLSFREGPVVIRAIRKLSRPPDVLLIDGQGLAHPRRCGIASHVGACLDLPSVGCAKSRLVGTGEEPGPRRGDAAPLLLDGEVIGLTLRTRQGTKPVYVSVGHAVNLDEARRLVLRATGKFRISEPLRRAHHAVTLLRISREERSAVRGRGGGERAAPSWRRSGRSRRDEGGGR